MNRTRVIPSTPRLVQVWAESWWLGRAERAALGKAQQPFISLKFKIEPEEAKPLFLLCFASNLLIIIRESCSPSGRLVAARSLSAGEIRAHTKMRLAEGWGFALCLLQDWAPRTGLINHLCRSSGSQCLSERLSSRAEKWIIQMTAVPSV